MTVYKKTAHMPRSPFKECQFCGSFFDNKFHRSCPKCFKKFHTIRRLLEGQEKEENIAKLEKFLDTAIMPNPEYLLPFESIEPLFEVAVREIFAQRSESLGYEIIKSQIGFPDYLLKHDKGVIRAEAELLSSNFKRHKHDINECDLIVCWKHDWKDCPMAVLELKQQEDI